jgi:uncharacterized membrane protein
MSRRALRITLIVLSVLGVALATYLTYIHYANIKPLCGRGGGTCLKVQTSQYSKLAGVPVALMGLIGYILILGTLLAPEEERWRFATAALTLGGFAFSAYLTYREVFSLEEICEYCVSSAVLLTVMLGLSLWRFLRGDEAPAASAPVPGEPATPLGSPS